MYDLLIFNINLNISLQYKYDVFLFPYSTVNSYFLLGSVFVLIFLVLYFVCLVFLLLPVSLIAFGFETFRLICFYLCFSGWLNNKFSRFPGERITSASFNSG